MEASLDIVPDIDALALSADLDLISGFYRTHLCADVYQKLVQRSTHGAAADPQQDKHRFLVDCSVLAIEIESEIITVLNYIREIYRWRFLDLERLVRRPIDYAHAVKRLEGEPDPRARADFLQGLTPAAPDISTVVGALSRISISPVCEEKLRRSLAACDRVLALDLVRKNLLEFAAKRTELAAPNLAAVVGAATAAKLVGAAGGMRELSTMPHGRLVGLDARTRKQGGFSTADGEIDGAGYLAQTEIAREYYERKGGGRSARYMCCSVLARFVILAARLDLDGKEAAGAAGTVMAKEVRTSLDFMMKRRNSQGERKEEGGGFILLRKRRCLHS